MGYVIYQNASLTNLLESWPFQGYPEFILQCSSEKNCFDFFFEIFGLIF